MKRFPAFPYACLLLIGIALGLLVLRPTLAQDGRAAMHGIIHAEFRIDEAIAGTSGPLRTMKLGDVLKRTTTASLPKGPQGGVELTFVAVIAKGGKVLTTWASNPVQLDGTTLRRVDSSGMGEIDSPWEAFDDPIEGFQEPLVGYRDPFLAFGTPLEAGVFTYDERTQAGPFGIPDVLTRPKGTRPGGGEYILVLTVQSPRDAASYPISVRPAVVPFAVREAASR